MSYGDAIFTQYYNSRRDDADPLGISGLKIWHPLDKRRVVLPTGQVLAVENTSGAVSYSTFHGVPSMQWTATASPSDTWQGEGAGGVSRGKRLHAVAVVLRQRRLGREHPATAAASHANRHYWQRSSASKRPIFGRPPQRVHDGGRGGSQGGVVAPVERLEQPSRDWHGGWRPDVLHQRHKQGDWHGVRVLRGVHRRQNHNPELRGDLPPRGLAAV